MYEVLFTEVEDLDLVKLSSWFVGKHENDGRKRRSTAALCYSTILEFEVWDRKLLETQFFLIAPLEQDISEN